MKKYLVLMIVIIIVLISGCTPEPTATPTSIPSTQTATLDYAATEAFEATEAQMVVEARQTEEMAFQHASKTSVVAITETEIAYATATRKMEKTNNAATDQIRRTGTAMVKQTETAVQEVFEDKYTSIVQDLHNEGYVSTVDGNIYKIEAKTWDWAQIDWFNSFHTGEYASDFVLFAHIDYSAASDKTNWFNSGCGFLFRIDNDNDDYYAAFAMMDGNGEMFRMANGKLGKLQNGYYGKAETPVGEFEYMLIVEGTVFRLFVNGVLAITYTDTNSVKGGLAYSLVSGTNTGYGTRCAFSDVVLYEINP